MVHMVFDYIIVDRASLRPTLGTGLNVYVGHDLLSLGSFCWKNENYTKPKPLPALVVCVENSDSDVLMMQPADEGLRYDASDPLDGSRYRCILVQ
jgi:hypothetical protein